MNLYLFNDNDSAARFGIGTYLNELTHAMEGTDIRIHVVHLHSGRSEFEIVRSTKLANRVENWYIPEVRNQNTFDGPIQKVEYYYRNVIYLLRLNIKDRKDLIFHFNYNQCFALAKGLKEVFDCKTVTTIHFMKWAFELQGNLQKLYDLKSKSENQMSSFDQLLHSTDEYEGLLYREADRVIALSRHAKNLLCNEYQIDPDKISVIPNGLANTNLLSESAMEELRAKRLFADKESIILFAGRLHPVKGLSYLIKAFRKVSESMSACRLIIAGGGNHDAYLQETMDIRTKVTFAGLLEKKELYELYQIAQVGVIPSLYEPFGYVALEMMMHGLPMVVTSTSGLNEVVDETCGLKIPVIEYPDRVEPDTDLLAEKIIYLLSHPEEAARMGHNARKRFETYYSTRVFRHNMIRFYESLFDERTNNN